MIDLFAEALLFLFSFLILLHFTAKSIAVSFIDILKKFFSAFDTPEYNLIFVKWIGLWNVHVLLIFLITFSSVGILLYRQWRYRENKNRHPMPAVIFSGLMVLGLVSGIRLFDSLKYFTVQYKSLAGQNTSQKKALVLGDLYRFALFGRDICQEQQKGFLFLENMETTTGAFQHLALAYHLFPLSIQPNPRQVWENRQIRKPDEKLVDCLLVYQYPEPESVVPPDFKITAFDTKSLVAAGKKPLKK